MDDVRFRIDPFPSPLVNNTKYKFVFFRSRKNTYIYIYIYSKVLQLPCKNVQSNFRHITGSGACESASRRLDN